MSNSRNVQNLEVENLGTGSGPPSELMRPVGRKRIREFLFKRWGFVLQFKQTDEKGSEEL